MLRQQNQLSSSSQSCAALTITSSGSGFNTSLITASCTDVYEGICEVNAKKPIFKAYAKFSMDSIAASSFTGFYNHPMNSISACSAICAAKTGIKSILVKGKICACLSGAEKSSHH